MVRSRVPILDTAGGRALKARSRVRAMKKIKEEEPGKGRDRETEGVRESRNKGLRVL